MDNKLSKKVKESYKSSVAPVPPVSAVAQAAPVAVAPVEKKPRKPRGPSPFMAFVSNYQKSHAGLSRAEAMKQASVEYQKNKANKKK